MPAVGDRLLMICAKEEENVDMKRKKCSEVKKISVGSFGLHNGPWAEEVGYFTEGREKEY